MTTPMRRPTAMGAATARRAGGLALLAASLLLAGCAHAPSADPRDPLEPFNRGVFAFNDAVDRAVLKPVASAYNEVTPRPLRTGVHNFFNNIADGWSFVNQLLQGKPAEAMDSFFRFNINTLWGLFGLIDIASEMRIESRHEDFGQTLGRWGVPSGPYLVLPLLGPSTVRDATARLGVDNAADPVRQLDHVPTRNSLIALDVVQQRAGLLQATRVLDEAALDRYSFTRDVYLQKRRNDVYDGTPPPDEPGAADGEDAGDANAGR